MKKKILLSGLIIVGILFSGCALKTATNPELVRKFGIRESKAKANETVVYVINKAPNIMGISMRSFVGVNNEIYPQKHSTYSRLVLRNKINTLYITRPDASYFSTSTEGRYPDDYIRIDDRLGETLFFTYQVTDYISGEMGFIELDQESGMTLVMQTEKQNKPKEMPTYGHQIALMNPSFVDIKLMKKVESELNIDTGKARIVFYRTENFGGWKNVELGIWSKDGFVGGLKGDEFLVIDVEAGQHKFATQYGAWGILDTNVKAGKTYYVEVFAKWGWEAIYTKLIAKKSTSSLEEIKQQMAKLTEVTLDKSKIDTNIQLRLDDALPYVKNALENRNSVSVEYTDKLDASDGR